MASLLSRHLTGPMQVTFTFLLMPQGGLVLAFTSKVAGLPMHGRFTFKMIVQVNGKNYFPFLLLVTFEAKNGVH